MKGIVGQLSVSVAPSGPSRPASARRSGGTPSPTLKLWGTPRPRGGAAVSYVVPR